MKRSIPQLLRGRIRWIGLIGAASMLVSLNATRRRARALQRPMPGRPAAAAANQLQSIDVQKLNGNQLQLTLHLSGPAPAAARLHDRQAGAHFARSARIPRWH